jgi:hypothetical protein
MMFCVSDLRELAEKARDTEVQVATSEFAVYQCKLELAHEQAYLDDLIAAATIEATNAGKLDGKNAETRKAQLDVFLASHSIVNDCRERVDDLKSRLAGGELALAKDKADARYATRLYDIALTMCKAEVQPA